MDGGRVKWEKDKRPTDARRARSYAATDYKAPERDDATHPRLPRRGAGAHARRRASSSTCAARRNTPARACTCPTIRTKARCAAATSPARRASRGRAAINPEDGTFKTADELKKHLLRGEAARAGQGDDRLLPHRRAQQPHLVRAEVPARLPERPQLRRVAGPSGATWSACQSKSRSCRGS